MTLDEAILHAEEVAADCEAYENQDATETRSYPSRRKCAAEHRQLAAWLRELQERREKDNKNRRGNARWLINSDGYYPYCSACMAEPEDGKMTDFCPSCGARMEGKIT